MAKIPGLDQLRTITPRAKDLANSLDRISKSFSEMPASVNKTIGEVRDLQKEIDGLNKTISEGKLSGEELTFAIKRMGDMSNQIEGMTKKWNILGKVLKDKIILGFDKLAKTLLTINFGLLNRGINLLIGGIQRVYELKEKWARAIGRLNMTIGGLSPKMSSFRKEAKLWEGTLRGMGEDLGVGTQMAGEFAMAFDSMDMKGWSRLGLQLARGFNLGAEGGGQLAKTFRFMGLTGKEATGSMNDLMIAGQVAGVPINALAKDLADSRDYMAEFGKTGVTAFVRAAAFAKQFGMSLRDLEKTAKVFDKFDDAATNVAKLNAVFGTTINAMDMMMTDDPAERIETVRQQILAQGKDFNTLSRQERLFLGETLNLSQTQLAAILDQNNANKTYLQMQEDTAKKEDQKRRAQERMQQQLMKTSQTLFNFGAAMDRITVAIANAIKPMLEVLGLADKGSNKFGSFGEVMKRITDKIVLFFNTLAKNRQWKDFMRSVAESVITIGKKLGDIFSPGKLPGLIDQVISGFKKFLYISTLIVGVWASSKIIGTVGGLIKGIKDIGQIQSIAKGAPAGASGQVKIGKGMRVLGGAAMGATAGAITGGGTMGGTIGGAIGGGLASLIPIIGPFLAPIGGAIGGFIGKLAQDLLSSDETKELNKAIEERKDLEEKLNDMQKVAAAEKAVFEARRNREDLGIQKDNLQLERLKNKSTKEGVIISAQERESVKNQIEKLQKFNETQGTANELLKNFSSDGGPVKLTKKQLEDLQKASSIYVDKVDELRENSIKLSDQIMNEYNQRVALQAADTEAQKKIKDLEIQQSELREKELNKQIEDLNIGESWAKRRTAEGQKELLEKSKQKEKLQTQIEDEIRKRKGLQTDREKIEKEAIKFALDKLNKDRAIEQQRALIESGLLSQFTPMAAPFLSVDQQAKETALRRFAESGQSIYGVDPSFILEHLYGNRPMASGGIVTGPTRALIGEAGPEAVIPLRAMATGLPRTPSKFGGDNARRMIRNMSSSNNDNNQTVKVVAGDVYLDGKLVGRHIVRDILRSNEV